MQASEGNLQKEREPGLIRLRNTGGQGEDLCSEKTVAQQGTSKHHRLYQGKSWVDLRQKNTPNGSGETLGQKLCVFGAWQNQLAHSNMMFL